MKSVLLGVPLVVLWFGTAVAQDAVKVAPKVYRVVLENDAVRVLRVSLPPGGKTPLHSHPDNMVIALDAAKVRFAGADGKSQDAEMATETASYHPAETHTGENIGKTAADAIVVEFKTAKPGTATVPTTRDNLPMKVLAEGPRAIVVRSTADPTFAEPAGSKHDYDQVVIALGSAQMSLAIDGKPAKTTWRRGDVQFIGRGTAHESKNAGGKPVDFIIVGIK
jgi:quercetin dioxygenase-like cupin family protein